MYIHSVHILERALCRYYQACYRDFGAFLSIYLGRERFDRLMENLYEYDPNIGIEMLQREADPVKMEEFDMQLYVPSW